MDSLNSWLGTQLPPVFWLLVVAGIVLVLAILSMFAWRAISRPHVKSAARNGRQPRLGVVDSYSVGVRQLVLVRRDNVEHLIMIGGPNDLVVESGILRARPSAQIMRPAGNGVPAAPPLPERAPSFPPAPRHVEEELSHAAESDPQPAIRLEPLAQVQVAPIIVPQPVVGVPPTAPASPASSASPAARPGLIPPREPGFFQRATSRFPNFGRPTASAAPAVAAAASPKEEEVEDAEPRATIDAAHFEELLADNSPLTASRHQAPAEHAEPEAHVQPVEEIEYETLEAVDVEPAPDVEEPIVTESEHNEPDPIDHEAEEPEHVEPEPREAAVVHEPAPTRLSIPELRLPDLKLPEWRRPASFPAPEPTPQPAPRPTFEPRVEPRLSTEPRPSLNLNPRRLGERIEPTLAPSSPAGPVSHASAEEHEPAEAPPATTRPEPFRVGERLTTPTRPMTPPSYTAKPVAPEPTPAPAPAKPEDPFASLEEEMANLLGRTRDDKRP